MSTELLLVPPDCFDSVAIESLATVRAELDALRLKHQV